MLGRRVAIKLLADHFADDFVAVRRFKREARTAARVSAHPNIITIFDVGETVPSDRRERARPFIVMEHLPGGTVADALRTGEVSRDDALQWLREASSALDYAHEHGVIHRDIKPANMLLDRARSLHVGDFGIARIAHEDTITKGGQLFGTAAYLSPEQARGEPGDRGERPLRARGRRLRAADRRAAVHRRALRRPGPGAHRGRASRRQRGQRAAAAGGRQRAHPRTRQGAGRPLAERRSVRRRPDHGDATRGRRAVATRPRGGSDLRPPLRAGLAPSARDRARRARRRGGAGDRRRRRARARAAVRRATARRRTGARTPRSPARRRRRPTTRPARGRATHHAESAGDDRDPAADGRRARPRPRRRAPRRPRRPRAAPSAETLEARGHALLSAGSRERRNPGPAPGGRPRRRPAASRTRTRCSTSATRSGSPATPRRRSRSSQQRLRIPNQTDVVRAELAAALAALHPSTGAAPVTPGGHHGHRPSGGEARTAKKH